MFGSIFNTDHGAPILCCTTTDLEIFLCEIGIFGTVLGIFGVAFVRAPFVNSNMKKVNPSRNFVMLSVKL